MMFYLPEIPHATNYNKSVIREEKRNFQNYCKVLQVMFVHFLVFLWFKKLRILKYYKCTELFHHITITKRNTKKTVTTFFKFIYFTFSHSHIIPYLDCTYSSPTLHAIHSPPPPPQLFPDIQLHPRTK